VVDGGHVDHKSAGQRDVGRNAGAFRPSGSLAICTMIS
jgi:hypothetical protein